jgi:hypothetical protein
MAAFGVDDDNNANVPNREQLLSMAIDAAKAGNRDGARVMLRQVLGEDRRNERAMMWLAKIAPSKAERREWLKRVLTVNPDNQAARDALRKINYQSSARDNRVLVMFGIVAVVLAVVGVVVLFAVISLR